MIPYFRQNVKKDFSRKLLTNRKNSGIIFMVYVHDEAFVRNLPNLGYIPSPYGCVPRSEGAEKKIKFKELIMSKKSRILVLILALLTALPIVSHGDEKNRRAVIPPSPTSETPPRRWKNTNTKRASEDANSRSSARLTAT